MANHLKNADLTAALVGLMVLFGANRSIGQQLGQAAAITPGAIPPGVNEKVRVGSWDGLLNYGRPVVHLDWIEPGCDRTKACRLIGRIGGWWEDQRGEKHENVGIKFTGIVNPDQSMRLQLKGAHYEVALQADRMIGRYFITGQAKNFYPNGLPVDFGPVATR